MAANQAQEAGIEESVQRGIDAERRRVALWLNWIRVVSQVAWLAFALVSGVIGGRLEGLVEIPFRVGAVIVAGAILFASRRWASVLRVSPLALAVVDVPMLFVGLRTTLELSERPATDAAFALSSFLFLILLALLSLDRKTIVATAVMATAAQLLLFQSAGLTSAGWTSSVVLVVALVAAAAIFVAGRIVSLVRGIASEQAARARLTRYFSPAVASRIAEIGGSSAEGEHHEVSILFSDIRGFTALSEKLESPKVVALLNEYLTVMVDVIFKHGGTLDKFIGDCVMAFFGAPMPQPDHAQRAVRAAVEIQRSIKQWNDERAGRGGTPLLSRIALNSGPVVVGDVGSNKRVDYTVLGNTVNVAARLEQAATGPGEIVIGGATLAELASSDGEFRTESLGEFSLKGLVQKVPVYRVQWAE